MKLATALPYVGVVTVNYNSPANTIETLASLGKMTYPRFGILLVENGSSERTSGWARENAAVVEVLESDTNLGFAGGYNLGITAWLERGADAVLVINNDVTVAPDMLDCLVDALDDTVGAVSPFIYYAATPQRLWSAGFGQHPLTLEMTGGLRNRDIHADPARTPFEVDYLLGCAMLLPRQALLAAGAFDPRFFLYYEDLDLSVRLRQSGRRLLVQPAAAMWHKVAGSTGLGTPCRTYHMARSSVLFFHKHARAHQAPFVLAWRILSGLRRSGELVFAGRWRALAAYWTGVRHGFNGRLDDEGFCRGPRA